MIEMRVRQQIDIIAETIESWGVEEKKWKVKEKKKNR